MSGKLHTGIPRPEDFSAMQKLLYWSIPNTNSVSSNSLIACLYATSNILFILTIANDASMLVPAEVMPYPPNVEVPSAL